MAKIKYGEKEIRKAELESWPNPCPERDYAIEISFPEFTCLCPRSGYPDFATIRITYVPDRFIVELKSLKLYLNSYRDRYISHEEATNKIFSDLEEILSPRIIKVEGGFQCITSKAFSAGSYFMTFCGIIRAERGNYFYFF